MKWEKLKQIHQLNLLIRIIEKIKVYYKGLTK
jgi:hypothetical protein